MNAAVVATDPYLLLAVKQSIQRKATYRGYTDPYLNPNLTLTLTLTLGPERCPVMSDKSGEVFLH